MWRQLEELWTNPATYNFASSEWGGLVFHAIEFVVFLVVVRWIVKPWINRLHHHLECEVDGCTRWGHPVHNTSHRACHEHHPHLSEHGHTAAEIAHAAEHGHNDPTAGVSSPTRGLQSP